MSNRVRQAHAPDDILAVLDVGSSKITCLIAARGMPDGVTAPPQFPRGHAAAIPAHPRRPYDGRAPHAAFPPAPAPKFPTGHATIAPNGLPVRILGVGHQRSLGVKAGVVVDLAAAEQSIQATIAQAERAAGVAVGQIIVGVACGRLKSLNFRAHAPLAEHPVNDADIARVMAAGQSYAERDGRRLVHLNRIAWRLDGLANIQEPRGMRGSRIEADLHAVTADEPPLRNLVVAVERADVRVVGFVTAPFAAGLAASSGDERRFGVTVIDIGAGLTTLSYFADGHLLHVDALAIGGGQITYDIARRLTIPLAQAERIKTLYGTVISAPSDDQALIAYPQGSDDADTSQLSRGRLSRMIVPRAEEILRQLRERLDRSPFAPVAAGHVVLTGGASQLSGMREFAAHVLGRPVRIGRPAALSGLPGGFDAPAFAVGVGLIESLFVPGACVLAMADHAATGAPSGYLDQVGHWLRKSF